MKNKKLISLFALATSALIFVSCKSDSSSDSTVTIPTNSVTEATTSYKVSYVPGTMDAMEGKTKFQIIVTDLDGVALATTPTVTLAPMMTMESYSHAAPHQGCTNVDASTWDCVVYYLMPSEMNGTVMGTWDLGVTVEAETASFTIDVGMAMNGSGKYVLKGGSGDQSMSMAGGSEGRSYFIFKSAVDSANGTMDVFVATKESMTSFPTLVDGITLNAGTMYEYAVSNPTVKVSTDMTTWTAMTDGGDGTFQATGLSLTADSETTIYFQLSDDNETKTTDGTTADGTNDFVSITFTP